MHENFIPSDGFSIGTEQQLWILFCILLILQLHFSLYMLYFINLMLKISTFVVKKCSVPVLPTTMTSKRLAEMTRKSDGKFPSCNKYANIGISIPQNCLFPLNCLRLFPETSGKDLIVTEHKTKAKI